MTASSSELKHVDPEQEQDASLPDEWGPTVLHSTKALFEVGDVFFYSVVIAVFFGSLHTYGDRFWSHILANYSKPVIILGGSFIVSQVGFWFWVSLLAILDLYQFPKSFWRYKIQPQKVPTQEWYWKAFWVALQNQFLVGVPTGLLLYKLMDLRGNPIGMEFPTMLGVAKEMLGFLVIEEVGFYYGHRLLHLPRFYKRIHKQHHLFTAPIGIAAIYCHPLEHFMCNLSPLLLGPVVMKSHVLTLWLWITIGQTNAINSHCGFQLPLFPSPLGHDYHHEVFNKNYGPVGVLDWFHGTAGTRKMAEEKKQLRAAAAAAAAKKQQAELKQE
ncbi:Chromosome 5 4 [Haplosporangium gracile]|nr:Chromosome 5 4 [Haplosporangium gracile]